ncbi:MAG: TSUP family transporter, partial [Actinomycetota bacterium]|nr:TSUP family transporter [Actinomycetota bacterium]
VGITASAALLVAAIDGRLDLRNALAIVAGSLLGGQLGAGLQRALPDRSVRRLLALVLGAAAVVLVVRA